MNIDRRKLLAWSGVAVGAALPASALAAPQQTSAFGIDAAHLGVRPGNSEDQSAALQRALDQAARQRLPLVLAPGTYRIGNIRLPNGAQLIGTRGATRLAFSGGSSLFSAEGANHITLSGLVIDGAKRPMPDRRALIQLDSGLALRIVDCEIAAAGGNAIALTAMGGEISGTTISDSGEAAIFSNDARGLTIARNTILGAGNNGILVWRSAPGDDGTIVVDNRIERIAARSGGSGQNGNAVNVYRAGNVSVRGNRMKDCAFSAVRGNAASNIQMTGNNASDMGEVALYSEFGFEGAIIANNVVDGAAIGVSVTNFNEGGRLAVVQGNIVRNVTRPRPAGTDPGDGSGIGIAVEADTAVTGNVVENASTFGFVLGWERYLRDVTLSANVVRRAQIGVGVSISQGAGTAVITDNVISGTSRGAIVGMDGRRSLTGDLAKDGAARYAHLTVSGNKVS